MGFFLIQCKDLTEIQQVYYKCKILLVCIHEVVIHEDNPKQILRFLNSLSRMPEKVDAKQSLHQLHLMCTQHLLMQWWHFHCSALASHQVSPQKYFVTDQIVFQLLQLHHQIHVNCEERMIKKLILQYT